MNEIGLAGYEAFLAVADGGGFGIAARELGTTQSTVSRRVAQLEARLGVKLIARTTRAVALTPAGQIFVGELRDSLSRLKDAEALIAGAEAQVAGLLRITMPSAFGRSRVTPLIGKLMTEYPRLRFELDLSDRYVDLQSDRFDLAIRFSDEAPSGWSSQKIGGVQAKLCASPSYLERAGAPADPAALSDHRLLAARTYAPRTTWTFFSGRRPETIQISPAAIVSDFSAMLALTIAGGGVAGLPDYLADPALAAGDLVELFPESLRVATPIFVMSPSELTHVPRIQIVVAALRRSG